MKRITLPLAILFMMCACNNTDKKQDKNAGHTNSGNEPATLADSLKKEIDDGHVVAMSKIGKLHNTKKQIQALIDSIGKLSAKIQQSASPYIAKLQALVKDLENADFAMDKWMPEYYSNTDTLADNESERLKYLNIEKIKVTKMKDAILSSIQKADSLLKVKL